MPGTYKVSTNTSSLGTSAKFGAADINRITQTLNGDADIDSPDINSPLTLHSSKLFINNPGNTFAYTVIASAIAANRNLIIPLLTGSDTLAVLSLDQTFSNKTLDSSCIVDSATLGADVVTLTGSQTLTNKTLTTPTISAILNSGTLTLPATTDTLVGRATTDTLTNKTLTLPVISAVSNSGTVTFPTGTLTLASLTGTENLTNKTLDSTNTISSATSLPTVSIAKGGTGATTAAAGFDALSAMTTAGDTQYGGVSGTRTRLAIGTANQLLRTNSGATAPEWASTLSGLTLTAPVISTISNTGTITLPTSTDTLVGKATTDTLTNKTLTTPVQTSYEDFTAVAVPSAPGAGVVRKYTDSGNSNHVRSINSAGTITDYDTVDFIESARTRYGFLDDFVSQVSSASGSTPFFTNSCTGTGAIVSTAAIVNANQLGIGSYQTGTTTTGRASGSPALLTQMRLGQGLTRYETFVQFPTLSDGTDTYLARFGFFDSQTADATDGAYFEYDSTLSANWRCCTSSNSSRTKNISAIAVDTAFNRLTIIVNAAGTSASFYVNGTELTGSSASPITTNIPTAAGRETCVAHMILKSAGTTSRLMNFDYIAMQCDLTTRRV